MDNFLKRRGAFIYAGHNVTILYMLVYLIVSQKSYLITFMYDGAMYTNVHNITLLFEYLKAIKTVGTL